MKASMPRLSLRQRLRLGWGKLRRFCLHTLNRQYIRENLPRRRGSCRRCGACCKLMFVCPHLEENGGGARCLRHETRWTNCRIFPADERDLADRDLVMPDEPCGFHFLPKKARTRRAVREKGGRRAPVSAAVMLLLSGAAFSFAPPAGAVSGPASIVATSGEGARVEIWVEIPTSATLQAEGGEVRVKCGDFAASLGRGAISLRSAHKEVLTAASRSGRFRLQVEVSHGLVTARAAGRSVLLRLEFRRRRASKRSFEVAASGGARILRAKAKGLGERERPKALFDGDRAYLEERFEEARKHYGELADSGCPPDRAEAAWKLGLIWERLAVSDEAEEFFLMAVELDPNGPWGERGRVALARLALEEEPLEALRLATELVSVRSPHIELWHPTKSIVGLALHRIEEAGQGPAATFYLKRIARGLAWAADEPGRIAWAYERLSKLLRSRGRFAEAELARAKAESWRREQGRLVGLDQGAVELPIPVHDGAPDVLPLPVAKAKERRSRRPVRPVLSHETGRGAATCE